MTREEILIAVENAKKEAGYAIPANLKKYLKEVLRKPNEKPKDGEMILAICDNMPIICGPNNSDFEQTLKDFGIKQWSYVKDLIP